MNEAPTKVVRPGGGTAPTNRSGDIKPQQMGGIAPQRMPPAPAGGHDALPRRVDEVDLGATRVSRTTMGTGGPTGQARKPVAGSGARTKGNGTRRPKAKMVLAVEREERAAAWYVQLSLSSS